MCFQLLQSACTSTDFMNVILLQSVHDINVQIQELQWAEMKGHTAQLLSSSESKT